MTDQPEGPQEPEDPFVGMHYRVEAYVARGEAHERPHGDEFVTFNRVREECPKDARFVVAQMVRIRRNPDARPGSSEPLFYSDKEPSGPFVVWDMQDAQLIAGKRTGPNGTMPPSALWMHESLDGMIMKALSFYDHHPG